MLCAPRGNEELVMQVVNFGNEAYMDLADALSMAVLEIMQGSRQYHPFSSSLKNLPRPEKGEDDDFADLRPTTSGMLRELTQFRRRHRGAF